MANPADKIVDTKAGIIMPDLHLLQSVILSSPAHMSSLKFMRFAFWKAFWLTMRPYLIFVSGAAGLVGLSFLETLQPTRLLLAFLPLLFSYGLGQALTDCFQTDTDALSSPYRPLVCGVISRKQVLGTSLGGLTLAVIILACLNPFILIPGTVAVLGLIGYTFFKKRWWGGPFWNSWIVALLPVIGKMTGSDFRLTDVIVLSSPDSLAFVFAVLAVMFGYGNFVVMGYLKDISADRQTGYKTFPVVFGWTATAVYSDVLAVAAAVFTSLTLLMIRANAPATVIFVVSLSVNSWAQVKIHGTRDERKAHEPIAHVVRAFILYSLSIVVALHLEWLAVAAVFYLLFETALKYRPEKTQV